MEDRKNCERVRDAYVRSGLSYQEIAELTGLKENSLACWITGRRNPTDFVANYIEEKVSNYLKGGGEYINKSEYRDIFAEKVYHILETVSIKEQPRAIMRAFDELPTVVIGSLGSEKIEKKKTE